MHLMPVLSDGHLAKTIVICTTQGLQTIFFDGGTDDAPGDKPSKTQNTSLCMACAAHAQLTIIPHYHAGFVNRQISFQSWIGKYDGVLQQKARDAAVPVRGPPVLRA